MKVILSSIKKETTKLQKSISAHHQKCAEISKEVNKWGKKRQTKLTFLQRMNSN